MKPLDIILGFFAAFIAGLLPLYALSYLIYVIVSLPLRRQERARLFLDLIETGLTRGRSMEATITSVSHTDDAALGVRFQLLAAHLETGLSLSAGLDKAAGLLPPGLVAMLKVGEEIGDPRRVMPACRMLLRDATSHLQSAYNYLVVLAFVLIPIMPGVFWAMTVFVMPRYQQIFADLLEGEALPEAPFKLAAVLSQIQIVIAVCFYLGAVFYMGGPRLLHWITAGIFTPKLDWLLYHIPWRKKRMERDFAAMLGVLLDAEIPEERAVLLAAESAHNSVFMRQAEAVATQLRQGSGLAEALDQLDNTGELRWRLTNALHSGKNFFMTLHGWLEALDARAFQQQQAFAQLVTTGLVLYNGVMVSLFAVFIFRALVMVIDEGVLW